jgi:hypothetical protein
MIALLVTAIAIVLAIPMSIVANLLTPPIRYWYSSSSQKRIKKRLSKLKDTLQASEQDWSFTPSEWATYKANAFLGVGIVFGIDAMLITPLGGFLFWLTLAEHSSSPPPHHLGKALLPAIIALLMGTLAHTFMSIIFAWAQLQYIKNCLMHSEEGRKALRIEIKKLIAKLKRAPVVGASEPILH